MTLGIYQACPPFIVTNYLHYPRYVLQESHFIHFINLNQDSFSILLITAKYERLAVSKRRCKDRTQDKQSIRNINSYLLV